MTRPRVSIRGAVLCAVLCCFVWLGPTASVSASAPPSSSVPPSSAPPTTTAGTFVDTTSSTVLPYAEYLSSGLETARLLVAVLVALLIVVVFSILRRKPSSDRL